MLTEQIVETESTHQRDAGELGKANQQSWRICQRTEDSRGLVSWREDARWVSPRTGAAAGGQKEPKKKEKLRYAKTPQEHRLRDPLRFRTQPWAP